MLSKSPLSLHWLEGAFLRLRCRMPTGPIISTVQDRGWNLGSILRDCFPALRNKDCPGQFFRSARISQSGLDRSDGAVLCARDLCVRGPSFDICLTHFPTQNAILTAKMRDSNFHVALARYRHGNCGTTLCSRQGLHRRPSVEHFRGGIAFNTGHDPSAQGSTESLWA